MRALSPQILLKHESAFITTCHCTHMHTYKLKYNTYARINIYIENFCCSCTHVIRFYLPVATMRHLRVMYVVAVCSTEKSSSVEWQFDFSCRRKIPWNYCYFSLTFSCEYLFTLTRVLIYAGILLSTHLYIYMEVISLYLCKKYLFSACLVFIKELCSSEINHLAVALIRITAHGCTTRICKLCMSICRPCHVCMFLCFTII